MIDKCYKKVNGVYRITNTINKKVYIGSSVNLYKRIYEHFRELKLNKHSNKILQNSFNKYGIENFMVDILESNITTHDEMLDLETYQIQNHNSHILEFGFNILPTAKGTCGFIISKERRQKISESNKGKKAHNKNKKMSDEQKMLLKDVNRKKYGISVDVFSKSGDFLETLNSVSEVCEKYNVYKNVVCASCKGRISGTRNYIFKYHNNTIELGREYKPKGSGHDRKVFLIYDINGHIVKKLPLTKDVVFFLNNSLKRHGAIERLLRKCKTKNVSVTYGNYTIKYEDAPCESNLISADCQPIHQV